MLFGTSDHIFNIHDVQLIIIFISLTKIKDIVENLDELPNRILLNLVHLFILCVFTSVLCGVNKEVKENNSNNKKPNPILAFYIQTRGAQTTI
jgi:p-aminobenzoyl-glutamate transporter AbgT